MIARAAFRATAAEIPGLRKAPGRFAGAAASPTVLRHADEQTVVGLVALLRAAAGLADEPGAFADWSVLAAPRFLGRAMFQVAFGQFVAEGAWGVSPHLVPAHSLHSPSGTFSQVLKAHGPNLGIGGTPGGEREALLAAATWLDMGIAPGVWLVASGRSDCGNGAVALASPGDYEAVALALTLAPPTLGGRRPRLLIEPGALRLDPSAGTEADRAEVSAWLGLADPMDDPGPSWRADAGHVAGSDHPPHHLRPGPIRVERPTTAERDRT